ncbi:T9SS type A sorting domain-containing protein [Allomuricauda sp. ARW1Y1]|jgi:hypothetical protein|uniref:T9SS type A sorting domain-containing protein n=1 Tax=Allomuricauda sp. ARW1Y1 TaxID=2663843 RepID=UPI0015CC829C|nr:T9SS type A sorting domain-containing protein [Muricauda sp. ARW1Y1]NYJ26013.1 hypothetical protein [Muricauda sp. ARW1Y1]
MKLKQIIFGICLLQISVCSSQEFTKHTIDGSLKNVRGSRVADLDNDGDLDIVALRKGTIPGPGISVWFNDGNGDFATYLPVHESKEEFLDGHADDIEVMDVNNDGFLDIVAAIQFDRTTTGGFEFETHDLAWWPNNQNQGFGNPIIIETNVGLRSQSIQLLDVDNNGFEDILTYSFDFNGSIEDAIWYWPNTGSGTFSSKEVFLQGEYRYFEKAKVNDDDLEDLVLVEWLSGIALGINNGSTSFEIGTISNIGTDLYFRIGLGFIDDDEVLDITASVFNSQTSFLSWLKGLGNAEFDNEQVIPYELDSNTAMDTGIEDFDDDGDADIVITTFSNNQPSLHMWENLGNGTFASRRTLNTDQAAGYSIQVADFDKDGDKDILQTTSNGVFWFENRLIGLPDDDDDGVINDIDLCPGTPMGASVDENGCSPVQLVDLGAQDILIKATSLSCIDSNDGTISIDFVKEYPYTVEITGDEGFSKSYTNVPYDLTFVENQLKPGTYQVCVGITDVPEYPSRCFSLIINNLESVSTLGKITVNKDSKKASITVQGSSLYVVQVNGVEFRFATDSEEARSIQIPLENGINNVSISTDNECQGVLNNTILLDKIVLLKNLEGQYSLNGLKENQASILNVYSLGGKLLFQKKIPRDTPIFDFELNSLSSGYYIVNLNYPNQVLSFKLYKD